MGLCTCLGLGLTSTSGCRGTFICCWVRGPSGPSSSFRLRPHTSQGGHSNIKQLSTICWLVFPPEDFQPSLLSTVEAVCQFWQFVCLLQRTVALFTLTTAAFLVYSLLPAAPYSAFSNALSLPFLLAAPSSAFSTSFSLPSLSPHALQVHSLNVYLVHGGIAVSHTEVVKKNKTQIKIYIEHERIDNHLRRKDSNIIRK